MYSMDTNLPKTRKRMWTPCTSISLTNTYILLITTRLSHNSKHKGEKCVTPSELNLDDTSKKKACSKATHTCTSHIYYNVMSTITVHVCSAGRQNNLNMSPASSLSTFSIFLKIFQIWEPPLVNHGHRCLPTLKLKSECIENINLTPCLK
jgi:hypothetical protein